MKTYFVSDLHVLSRRSQEPRVRHQLAAAADQASTFVLGGDIFDFRWSTMGFEQSMRAAEQWLLDLVGPRGHCQFHYLLGNHDCHPVFVQRLQGLATRLPNLNWHEEFLRDGDHVFLHGDVLDGCGTSYGLLQSRLRWSAHEHRGPFAHAAYDAAVKMRIHKAVGKVVNPRRRVAKRLAAYLDHLGHGHASGVREVYFGHTHVAVRDYHYGRLRFHNGGAPMPGLKFSVLEVQRV